MENVSVSCSVCGKAFVVKNTRQVQVNKNREVTYFCSDECLKTVDKSAELAECCVCHMRFEPQYLYQRVTYKDQEYYFCSVSCRNKELKTEPTPQAPKSKTPMRIAIINQKGGTGKTTTTVNVAAGLASFGAKVLVIDVDAQGHVAASLGMEVKDKPTIYDLIIKGVPLEKIVLPVPDFPSNLFIIPANSSLATCEVSLARMDHGRETLLRNKLQRVTAFDYILLDCGPSLSLINVNALTFADYLLVPVLCERLSLVGLDQLLQTLKLVNQSLHHPIEILGVLPTFFDGRIQSVKDSYLQLQGRFADKLFPPIHAHGVMKDISLKKQTLFNSGVDNLESRPGRAYQKVVDKIISKNNERLSKDG